MPATERDDEGQTRGPYVQWMDHARARVALIAVMLFAIGVVSACSSPGLVSQACTRAAENNPVLATLATRLTVDAALRNGQVVETESGSRFVSAELHREGDEFDVRGEIVTWVSEGANSFRSVDGNARRVSSWPVATSVDLRDAAARTSRGCVYPYRGRRACQQQPGIAPVAARGACPAPTTTTAGR